MAWLIGTFAAVALCVIIGLVIARNLNLWKDWEFGKWMWAAALLPAALIIQHALFVVFIKRVTIHTVLLARQASLLAQGGSGQGQKPQSYKTRTDLGPAIQSVVSQNDCYFNPFQVGLQYILATVFLAVIGPTLLYVCCDPPDCLLGKRAEEHKEAKADVKDQAVLTPAVPETEGKEAWSKDGKKDREELKPAAAPKAAVSAVKAGEDKPAPAETEMAHTPLINALRLGAAGAFVYVLTYLGRRNFQRDITVPAALWSSVQLVLGPTLAYTIAYFLVPSSKQDSGAVGFAAIYFLAGMSPRLIADWISTTVERVWLSNGAAVTGRTLPLTQVRGVTSSVVSRLGEEGIEDAAQLAMANAVKLIRNTPFDPRQILAWIDEAILITTLPDHWSTLEKEGITGAMDLAWYLLSDGEQTGGGPLPFDGRAALNKLAANLKMEPDSLYQVALRLLYDDQVEMIWAMYESNGGEQEAQLALQ